MKRDADMTETELKARMGELGRRVSNGPRNDDERQHWALTVRCYIAQIEFMAMEMERRAAAK